MKDQTGPIAALCTFLVLLARPSLQQGSQSSITISPCPNVLMYELHRSVPGRWHGIINLSTESTLHALWLNILFDEKVNVLGNWVGLVSTGDNKNFKIENTNIQIDPGTALPLHFYVEYHPFMKAPKVLTIRLNGGEICNAVKSQRPDTEKHFNKPDSFSNVTPIPTDECGVVAGGNERVTLVNNGNFYDRGQIPWLVAVYRIVDNNLLFICGGTIVSARHVVSAAHCMQRPNMLVPITEIVVKTGVHRLNDWSDDLTVTRKLIAAHIHEEYNPNTYQNDILIFTLNKPVMFNKYIRPACLWSIDTDLARVVGAVGVVAGWGARIVRDMEDINRSDEPQMVRVPIVSTKDCRGSKSAFHMLTYNTTLCAGDQNGAGPCKGDSGGGLYLLDGGKWRLRGVVSVSLQSENGALTCNLNEYVVYTDAAQFLPWIKNVLSEKFND